MPFRFGGDAVHVYLTINTVYRADLADVLFDVAHGMLAGDIPGAGSLRDMTPTPPGGWERHLDWTPPVG